MVTFSQINTSMPAIIDIEWPPEFVEFLANFQIVNIDLFALVGVSCVGNFDFYMGFLAQSCLPIVIFLWAMVDLYVASNKMEIKVTKMTAGDKNLAESEALHLLYHITDEDGDSTISPLELSRLLILLGWNADAEAAHDIMKHFHDDGTKEWSNDTGQLVLTEEEFVESMMSGKMIKLIKNQNTLRVGAKIHKETGEIVHTNKSWKETFN